MLTALVQGDSDPEALAELAKGTLRRKIPRLPRPSPAASAPTTP